MNLSISHNQENSSLLDGLNVAQKEAVLYKDGPLLIVAGAGTGKTTVITRRIAHLILEGRAKTDEILALTFTEKAADEMEERIDRLLPYGYVDLWVSTFHSFCERILMLHGLEIGLPHQFRVLNTIAQWFLVRKNFERFDLNYYRPLGNPTKFIHALLVHFSRAKDEHIRPKEYLRYAEDLELNADNASYISKNIPGIILSATRGKIKKEDREILGSEIARIKEVANAYHTYQQLLLEASALDFGDLINYTIELFSKRPFLLQKYQKKFKYILVDEFQDTNLAQYQLTKMLGEPRNNLTVCADDDQSIYKFRGASVSNVLTFKKEFASSKEVFLVENYRSAQPILDLSYQFITQNNPNRLEYVLNHSLKKEKIFFTKKLHAAENMESVIEHIHTGSEREETEAVAKKIFDLVNEQGANYGDFAILSRAWSSIIPFVQTLSKWKIPNQFFANRGLYSKSVALDIFSFLRLLDSYHESSAMFRFLSLPCFEISQKEINKLSSLANRKAWSLYEAARNFRGNIVLQNTVEEKLENLLRIIDHGTTMLRDKTVSEIVLEFLESSGYLMWLKNQEESRAREDFRYLNQLYKEILSFEEDQALEEKEKSVKNFLAHLDLCLDAGHSGNVSGDREEGPDVVKIMTIHAAKGLEFSYVFIVNLVDKRFPTIERGDPISLPTPLIKEILSQGDIHLEEERRLMYVAMTRAKCGLFFTSADDYGGTRKKKMSRFLTELGFEKICHSERPPATLPDRIGMRAGSEESREQRERSLRSLDPCLPAGRLPPPFAKSGIRMTQNNSPSKNIFITPSKFSFTQLRAFETCPLQYKFGFVYQIPRRGNSSMSYGRSLHSALQKFFELARERSEKTQGNLFDVNTAVAVPPNLKIAPVASVKKLVSENDLLDIYDQVWIDDWYESKSQKESYRKQGVESLKKFYAMLSEEQTIPKYIEQGFHLRIGEYTLHGKIDRADEIEPGKLEIIDYKTGRPKDKDKLSLDDKEQLLIYQMAVEQMFPEETVRLSFYYLDSGNKISFLGDKEELENLKEKILLTIKRIRENRFDPRPGMMCKFCDYRNICEFRAF